MSQSTKTTTTTSVGRPCSICSSSHHGDIDAALIEGDGISRVSREFDVSPDALRRHGRSHLGPEARAAMRATEGLSVPGIAARVLDVADSARATRYTAEDSGMTHAALRAGQAELQALAALADRLGIGDTETLDLLKDGESLGRAVGMAARLHPEVASFVGAALRKLNAADLAEALEAQAVPVESRSDPKPLEARP